MPSVERLIVRYNHRPRRVAFLVPEDYEFTSVDSLTNHCMHSLGGRFLPWVPLVNGSVTDQWFEFLTPLFKALPSGITIRRIFSSLINHVFRNNDIVVCHCIKLMNFPVFINATCKRNDTIRRTRCAQETEYRKGRGRGYFRRRRRNYRDRRQPGSRERGDHYWFPRQDRGESRQTGRELWRRDQTLRRDLRGLGRSQVGDGRVARSDSA